MDDRPVISSAGNPLVNRIRALSSDRRARRRESAFVVDGVAPVWRALDAGADIAVLAVAAQLPAGSAAERLVAAATAAGHVPTRLSNTLMSRLSGKDESTGVMAIVRADVGDVSALRVGSDDVVLALNEIGNPGNLGTIVRAADGAGASAVVTIGPSTDFLAPAAVKASMGSLFDVQVAHAESIDRFFGWAADAGLRVVTTSARATTEHWSADWTPPVALLLGSEGDGLAPEVIARGDDQVRIPMVGRSTSLNLSVAAAILLFEARRSALSGAGSARPKGPRGRT